MNSPSICIEPRITREEMEKSFRPCPICGAREINVGGGVYRIYHNYELHFPDDPRYGKKPERVA